MPEGTDRYNVDQSDLGARFEERFRALEQKVAELDRRAPLNSAVFRGILRNVDDNGDTLGTWGPTGLALEEGAFSVGGGPVRAVDFDYTSSSVTNVSLDTTMTAHATTTLTVPDWVNEAAVFAWIVFQMSNSSGVDQDMQFRVDIEGVPGTGAWTHTCKDGDTANTTDMQRHTLIRGTDLGSTIDVEAVAAVAAGTNGANIIRARAVGFFFR